MPVLSWISISLESVFLSCSRVFPFPRKKKKRKTEIEPTLLCKASLFIYGMEYASLLFSPLFFSLFLIIFQCMTLYGPSSPLHGLSPNFPYFPELVHKCKIAGPMSHQKNFYFFKSDTTCFLLASSNHVSDPISFGVSSVNI